MVKELLPKFWKSGKTLSTFLALAMMCIILTGYIGFAEPSERVPQKKRILVKPRTGLSKDEMKKIVQRHRGRMVRHLKGINVRVVEISDDEDVAVAIENLSKDPFVKFVEEDRLFPPEEISANDPYYGSAWHLRKIEAPSAWETSMGDGVVVAVLDTGVDEDHPDLSGQTVPGWNIYDNDADTSDVHGHGTRVAGVVAAASDNGIGVTSIAWHAFIMPVRISRPDGYASASDIAEGIIWAADHGAQVASISYDVSGSLTIENAAAYMRERGGMVVVAAGNSGVYRSIAPSPALISVGATDEHDIRASFSAYGEYLDLVAPGTHIYSTRLDDGYSSASGTSMSCPMVAGVAALMMSVNPLLNPAQIDTILTETTDDLGDGGWDIYHGAGRVNAAGAVLAAWESSDVDTESPTVVITSPTGGPVSGVIPIDVSAVDNVGVIRVDLYINGTLVGTETNPPFAFSWDSTTVPDGPVTLVAYAYDAAENEAISSTVWLDLQNSPVSQICGDLDSDGVVGYHDFMILRKIKKLRAGDPGYVSAADFDGDQYITIADFAAWYRCYVAYVRGR